MIFYIYIQAAIEEAGRPETKLLRIGSSCEPGLFLDVFNKKNRAAVEAYINYVVGLDTEVPYIFTTLEGKITFEDKGGVEYQATEKPLRAIGKFSKIYFQKIKPSSSNHGAGDW